jgi:HlyD family secretion protein
MKLSRQSVLYGGCALILLGALFLAFRPGPVRVDLVRAATGPLRVTVDEDGRTRIKERYVVSAPIGGLLRRIELHPGDHVTAGVTGVAVIEPGAPELLDARTRAQLEARLRAAAAQVQLAVPRVDRARSARDLAEVELDRALTLMNRQAISRQELDRTRDASRAAAEELRGAEYARQIAGFELEQAQAALSRSSAETHPDDPAWMLRITAPVSGRVLRVFHEDAGTVAPGTPLVEFGDPTDLEAEIDVLSSDAVKIVPGARVSFDHWGGDTPLEGRVRVVEPAGFLKISALGVEEQRVNVIADFVAPPADRRGLGDAYRVEVRILTWESERVLKVPVGALFRSAGDWAVFVFHDGRVRLTRVVVGHSDGREAEIVRGLTEGEALVNHPSDQVADGALVNHPSDQVADGGRVAPRVR